MQSRDFKNELNEWKQSLELDRKLINEAKEKLERARNIENNQFEAIKLPHTHFTLFSRYQDITNTLLQKNIYSQMKREIIQSFNNIDNYLSKLVNVIINKNQFKDEMVKIIHASIQSVFPNWFETIWGNHIVDNMVGHLGQFISEQTLVISKNTILEQNVAITVPIILNQTDSLTITNTKKQQLLDSLYKTIETTFAQLAEAESNPAKAKKELEEIQLQRYIRSNQLL